MNRIFRRRFGFLAFIYLFATFYAGAQSEPPPAPLASVEPSVVGQGENKSEDAFQGLVGAGKYRLWTHHTGKAEETVVAVEVTATDAAGNVVTRNGSGFVLRCDGFVLIPDLLAQRGDTGFRAKLSFVKADGDELIAPLETTIRPLFRNHKAPFVTLKVNDCHVPCLPALNPVNLRPEMPVRVVWAVESPGKPGKAKAVSRKAFIVGKPDKDQQCALRWAETKDRDAPEPVIGAVVADEKSGAALGIIAAPPTVGQSSFVTLKFLNLITDEAALLARPEDVPGSLTAPLPAPDMARIPGGPLRLQGLLADHYERLYKTHVVCSPPFSIDKNMVTVGQYRAYLRQFPAPRLPQCWDDPNEMVKDYRTADFPAVGMIHEDALAYAATLGKRLPTPVEWYKAAQGAEMQWLKDVLTEAKQMQDFLQNSLYATKKGVYEAEMRQAGKKETQNNRELIEMFVNTAPVQDLNRQQLDIQRRYFSKYWFPLMNSPLGFYREDVSAYGVRDVVTNAPELTVRNYAVDFSGAAPKAFPAQGDPYISFVERICGNGANVGVLENFSRRNVLPIISFQYNSVADVDGIMGAFLVMDNPILASVMYVEGRGICPGQLFVHPRNFAGFRCAR